MKESAQEKYKQILTKKYGFKIVKSRDNDCWWLSKQFNTLPALPHSYIIIEEDKIVVSAIVGKEYVELLAESFSFELLDKLLYDEKR